MQNGLNAYNLIVILNEVKDLLFGGAGTKQIPFDFAQGRLSRAKNTHSG
jgi:hypothetical protein